MQTKIMNIENSKAQLRKGILEFCVLALLKRDKEAYPSDLLVALKEADLLVVEGTLYPLLTRLKNEGLLNYRWEESKSGPPRKYYALTEQGELFYSELQQSWESLKTAVEQILKVKKPQ
jgi:PadR family transcriptional regulator PadR